VRVHTGASAAQSASEINAHAYTVGRDIVFAGERSAEFAARMAGQPYTGGGIATTVAATRAHPYTDRRQVMT